MSDRDLMFVVDGRQGAYGVRLLQGDRSVGQGAFDYDDTSFLALKAEKFDKDRLEIEDLQYVGAELWDRLRAGTVAAYFESAEPAWADGPGTCHLRLRIVARELEGL